MKVTFNNNFDNKSLSFKAHPDFDILSKRYEITASSYFRRGRYYGAPANEFVDVIKLLRGMFSPKSWNSKKKNMLIAGIGESQEPFSFLAVIKHFIKDKRLNDVLNLNVIDLQSKPKNDKLFEQSFYDCYSDPRFVKKSFVKDDGQKYGLNWWQQYRVNDEIFDFVKKTYNNSKKSHWDSRVQDVLKDMKSDIYDIVSINNTLGYIADNDVRLNTLDNVKRIVKKDGVFITDPFSSDNDCLQGSMSEIYKGIFKKN